MDAVWKRDMLSLGEVNWASSDYTRLFVRHEKLEREDRAAAMQKKIGKKRKSDLL